jgi:hypothetical protein
LGFDLPPGKWNAQASFALAVIAPNAPVVVSETIDGEAIIMHHGSGEYFDASGSGAIIWQAIENTTSRAAIAAQLVALYGLDPAHAEATTDSFLATLERHDLIRTVDGTPPPLSSQPLTGPPALPFAEPVLGVHTDLADMLLLDPIHDVDTAGWPAMRPQADAG